jgi:hypothetical protein
MEQVRDGEGAPRSWRGGRLLPAAVFVVLSLAAVIVFFVVRSNVDNQNRRLLRERTGEVALLLQSAVGNLPTSLQPLGVAQRLGGTQAFLDEANAQAKTAPTESIALMRTGGGPPTVIAAAGLAPIFPDGTTLTGVPARAIAAAVDGKLTATPVFRFGRTHLIGFALGSPSTSPGRAILIVVPIHPSPTATHTVTQQRPFDELDVAVYAAPRPDPSQLVLTTTKAPLTGDVAYRRIPVGGTRWLLAATAHTPLGGSFPDAVPWIVLAVGLFGAGIATGFLLMFQRRRDYALALVDARTAELNASLEEDRERLPEVAARHRRTRSEPWREKLWYMRAKLKAARDRRETGYADAHGYLEELELLDRSLDAPGMAPLRDGRLYAARRRAEVFGFHLATMDLRQHSAVHEAAVAELLAAGGIDGYAGRDERARVALLASLLERADVGAPRERARLSPVTRDLLVTLDVVGRARRDSGGAACERYVVSFTRSASDLLEVLFLARAARLGPDELRPVPLLEQLEDLERADQIAGELLSLAPMQVALRGELEVMVGYSDSTKELGYVASNWLLHRAQAELAAVADREAIELTLFHGRGGAIGRGGGQLELAVAAQPPGSVRGRLKLTEQGEVVWTRYGDPELALRHLEVLTSTALDSLGQRRGDPRGAGEVMDELAAEARRAYRALVFDDPGFAGFFGRLTPIDEITGLQLGSRPARRAAPDAARSIDDLRAIPWVCAGSQARVELPAWFGLGSGLEAFRRAHPKGAGQRLARLYRGWPFFRSIIDHARLALARADLVLAREYATLASAPGDAERWAAIEDEFERTRRELDRLPAAPRGGAEDRVESEAARRSSALRAPYVDTLSVVQLELLRTLRGREASDPSNVTLPVIRSLIGLTISGLSAALQGTG